ncbi:MAG: hypothetical protein K0B87_05520 [Candidatus Syntrophosphaera sp.]|nr:hypothetical protein [Candidatus Syntrophosphaera sp.]
MKPLILALVFSALAFSLAAQSGSETAAPGLQADYGQILAKLQTLAGSGVQNADLYYNLGVCHYHLGETGKAVLWFLRARNINSAHRAAKDNLVYIHSLDPASASDPQRPYLPQLMLNAYDFFSLNRLAVIVLILALLTTLCTQWLLHYPPEKEHGLPVLVLSVTAIVFLVFAGTLFLKSQRFRHNPKAVVMREATEVYDSPERARALHFLNEGNIVEIRERQGEMYRVVIADGTGGWIAGDQIERVVPPRQEKE